MMAADTRLSLMKRRTLLCLDGQSGVYYKWRKISSNCVSFCMDYVFNIRPLQARDERAVGDRASVCGGAAVCAGGELH